MPGRKRKTQQASKCGNELKGSAKQKKEFMEGDTVLCPIEMGVWWPGYVLDSSANRVSVAFWNENDIVKKSLSKLVKFEKNSSLIMSSIDKLKKKKLHTLIRKYEDDLCHAQKEGTLSSDGACTAEPRACNNSAIKRGEGKETNMTTCKGTKTMPHTGTAYESPGVMSPTTATTESSSSIQGVIVSEDTCPTIWTTLEIDSTKRVSEESASPTMPVETTTSEISSSASDTEKISETFTTKGIGTYSRNSEEVSTYLALSASEESASVSSPVSSMEKSMGTSKYTTTMPLSNTAYESPGVMSPTTATTESSSSIQGVIVSEDTCPTIWTTLEIDSAKGVSEEMPVETTTSEISSSASDTEKISETLTSTEAGTNSRNSEVVSTYLALSVSEESASVSSLVASMEKSMATTKCTTTMPLSNTAYESPGVMSQTTATTESSSSIHGVIVSEETCPTIWTTLEIDSTKRVSEESASPTMPVETTTSEISSSTSATEKTSETFTTTGAGTYSRNSEEVSTYVALSANEESASVSFPVSSMEKSMVTSKYTTTMPLSNTAYESSGVMNPTTATTELSSSIQGIIVSEETCSTIWTTLEMDSTKRVSMESTSPTKPVETTTSEISSYARATERTSETFTTTGAGTCSRNSEELSTYSTTLASEELQTHCDTLHPELLSSEMPQMSLLQRHCNTLYEKLPAFDECFNTCAPIYKNTVNARVYSPTEDHDTRYRSDVSTLNTELNLYQSINHQPPTFCGTLEADLPASYKHCINPIRETLYRQSTSLKAKGQKIQLDEMNFSDDDDDDDEYRETDSDGDSEYIPDLDCVSNDEDCVSNDEYSDNVSDECEFTEGKGLISNKKQAPILCENLNENLITSSLHNIPLNVNTEAELSANSSSQEAAPFKRDILPHKCICDETNPMIYLKRYENSSNSKHGRPYDRVHACIFCQKLMTNIQTHLEHKHRNEKDVKEILDLKNQIEEIKENSDNKSSLRKHLKNLQTLIRNRGNNHHNQNVLAVEEGEILLSRRRNSNTFNIKDYGPCPNCEEWIVLENISKHLTICPRKEKSCETKGSAIIQSKIMSGKISSSASNKLKTEVFPSMIRDKITEIAQEDHLITVLGNIWLLKNVGNKLRRKNFTSFRMRLSARLLAILREDAQMPSASMHYFLSPKEFDRVVTCAVKACEEDENEDLKNPSTAIKLGYDLSRLANAKLGIGIKEGNDKAKTEAGEFLQLLKMEWSVKVTKLARVTLDVRHFNKKKELPDPSDIEKIAAYLVREIKKLDLTISNSSEILFREAVVLAETRLLLYNRRRPGELECLSVEAYKNRSMSVDEANMALRNHLTDFERMLLKTQDLVEIRGKYHEVDLFRVVDSVAQMSDVALGPLASIIICLAKKTGRGVPVLIPNETKKVLEYLSNPVARQRANIRPENNYMFANTGRTVVRAGESLDQVKFRSEVELRFPERIYANNLRKHTATIAQALNLNDTEMKWICNHLGHTQKVHDLVYRQTSGMIERLDIAKLMLIQEYNVVGKFQNRKLSEIQFDELGILEEKACYQDQEQQDIDNTAVQSNNVDDDMDFEEDFVSRKKAKKSERVRWSRDEEDEIKKYFSHYFDGHLHKKCPSREHCINALKKSKENDGFIFKRKWETLKKKVSNMLVKLN